jgi:hypothetical protein
MFESVIMHNDYFGKYDLKTKISVLLIVKNHINVQKTHLYQVLVFLFY